MEMYRVAKREEKGSKQPVKQRRLRKSEHFRGVELPLMMLIILWKGTAATKVKVEKRLPKAYYLRQLVHLQKMVWLHVRHRATCVEVPQTKTEKQRGQLLKAL